MKGRAIIDPSLPMSPMRLNAPQGMPHKVNQRNDSEMVPDQLWCVLIRAIRGGVHRACLPTQGTVFSAGELLPIPFPATSVIASEKLRFHRCADLDVRMLPKNSCQRSRGRLCRSNDDEVGPLLLIGLRDMVVPTSKATFDGLITT